MSSILPIITMTDLQRRPKKVLDEVNDYAVIQSHGDDRAFILSVELGKALISSGTLGKLKKQCEDYHKSKNQEILKEIDELVGDVLLELSKK